MLIPLGEFHRLGGCVCYLKLPQLEQALKKFHDEVNAQPQNSQELEKSHIKLQQAIDAFLKELENKKF